jgi:hypothetical protein
MRVIPIDVYDKDGNLSRIDVQDAKGEFVMQILWDEHDEQTSQNRIAFREWAYKHLEQSQGYEVSR